MPLRSSSEIDGPPFSRVGEVLSLQPLTTLGASRDVEPNDLGNNIGFLRGGLDARQLFREFDLVGHGAPNMDFVGADIPNPEVGTGLESGEFRHLLG